MNPLRKLSPAAQALVREHVKARHEANVEISKTDPQIDPGLRFHSGFRANAPARPEINRTMRRKLERRLAKKILKGKP